eukprot:TRINITY_DN60072_c0_g1_i1.p1 TRINITY_DN60072_c0_g1~~TRINITY_DN60072_c0_g1_i1.p1  ORF type:complete len:1162 (+),score=450.20 TRINITY_DN60072_c0_g1_i1:91-3576(+)
MASGSAGLARLLRTMEANSGRSTVRDEVNEWAVVETLIPPTAMANQVNESLFMVGNGYIGVRASFEEDYTGPKKEDGTPSCFPGQFVNGFFESHKMSYPEAGHGWAHTDQVMLRVTESAGMYLTVDGERFDMYAQGCHVHRYRRELNFREGRQTRSLEWTSPKGKKVRIIITRVACLTREPEDRKHLWAINYQVEPLSADIKELSITSTLDGAVMNIPQGKDPRVGSPFTKQVLLFKGRSGKDPEFSWVHSKTESSGLGMVCAMACKADPGGASVRMQSSEEGEQRVQNVATFTGLTVGKRVGLTKFVAYTTTQGPEHWPDRIPEAELEQRAQRVLRGGLSAGFQGLLAEQQKFLDHYWSTADIEIRGDPVLCQGMRFNCFHLIQSVGRDGVTNIGASGLSGERYSGHYFWDTEVYIAPYFLYSFPEIAKQCCKFRISLLPAARERAKEMGQASSWRTGRPLGALYPWRTIAGSECSAYFPAGTAQLHINGDIAWLFRQYMEATDDMELLMEGGGAEMLLETARFWLAYGSWTDGGQHFKIFCVTGPDEYTCVINNNYYTNMMAQNHLEYAVEVSYMLRHEQPDFWAKLVEKISFDQEAELSEMKKASERMYLPFNKDLGIHPQDDSFVEKPEWDFENNKPAGLLTAYHYMIVYSHAVIKQADLVLSLLLHGNKFTPSEKKANFDFYEARTTHDSSLSACVHSVVASEVGYYQKAYNYFLCTARTDIDDLQGKTYCGIHTANMGGGWMCMVRGFGGLRVHNDMVHLNPFLPQEWEGYTFHIVFRGATLRVEVGQKKAKYTCTQGRSINFVHAGHHRVHLRKGRSIELLLKDKFAELTSLHFDSIIFDMDAVLPTIQKLHFEAWRLAVKECLTHFTGGDTADLPELGVKDYEQYIRNQVARDFIKKACEAHTQNRDAGQWSRNRGLQDYFRGLGLDLEEGHSTDPPGVETLGAISNLKSEHFNRLCKENPPKPNAELLGLLRHLRHEGIKLGLVSVSRSASEIVGESGLAYYFDVVLSGQQMAKLGMRGKPYLDTFQYVVEQLGTAENRTVLIIDDPVGFDYDELTAFKYIVGAPAASQVLWGSAFDKGLRERKQMAFGVHKVVFNWQGFNTDTVDEWVGSVDESEPYDQRIKRHASLRRDSVAQASQMSRKNSLTKLKTMD